MSDRIKNAPELLPGLQFYVDTFNLLTTSRQVFQGGIGHIPYGEVSRFCDDEGVHGDMREDLFFLLQQMDRFYVEWHAKNTKKKIEAETRALKPKTPARGRKR